MNRRDFLKTSAVGGGLVWAAPAVTTIARASAAGTPAPCERPAGACLSQAYGLSLVAPILPSPLVLGDNECVAGVDTLFDGPGSSFVRSRTLCGVTSTTPCHASGFAEALRVTIPGLVVQASVLRASAGSTGGEPGDCACSTAGRSVILGLRINGRIITVGNQIPAPDGIHVVAPCNTHLVDVAPLIDVILNEQVCTGDQLVVNALHIHSEVLGIDLIVGHAESGRANCVCQPCTPGV